MSPASTSGWPTLPPPRPSRTWAFLRGPINEGVTARSTRPRSREVEAGMRTDAAYLWEDGGQVAPVWSPHDVLLLHLWGRFVHLPERVPDIIRVTNDATRLDAWLDNFVNTQTLADVGLPARRPAWYGKRIIIDEEV